MKGLHRFAPRVIASFVFVFGAASVVCLFPGTATAALTFSGPTPYEAHTNPTAIADGDFNGDGRQDVAVANNGTDDVSILLGSGSGSFGPPTNFGAGPSPEALAVGDFNRDSNQDLVVVNPGSEGHVSVLLGTG